MSVSARKLLLCLVLAAGSLTYGCSSDDATNGVSRGAVVTNYSANLYSAYAASVDDAQAFQVDVEAFLAKPTEATLETARESWLASREHYMLTEGARFYDGPIDGTPENYEALLNSWPLDEAFIDYASKDGVVNEDVGIVNMPEVLPDITRDGLASLNGSNDEPENVSVGYHAVEFLLWGQALEDVGPGQRPATDYVIDGPSKNPKRRADYLKVAVEGIISDLSAVRDAWKPTAAYRVAFEKDANWDESLTHIFTGLAKFSKGELGSQRIGAAYESKHRHDQHDCFSSQTLVDYERDARGIQAMYLGTYGVDDGPGLDDLVKAADPALDADLKKKLQASIDAIVAIPKPFEDAIAGDDDSPGRQAIQAALTALSAQGDAFGAAAHAIGLTIQVDDPDE
ncbi:MAG TPA: imelysin family protein [Polyangiaceae bacterium]|jgi:putative iron-regulated protein|nr:imelysin family protein [Polyangiaceae bacterium]